MTGPAYPPLTAPGGKMVELFTTREERTAFFTTEEADAISKLIADLREAKGDPPPIDELANRANGALSQGPTTDATPT